MPDVTRNPDENPDAKASRIRLPKAPPAREATPEPGTATTPGTATAPGTAPAPEAPPAPNAGAPLKEAPVTAVTPVTPAAPDPTAAHGASTTPTPDATAAPAREGAVPGREGGVPGREGGVPGHEGAVPSRETTAPSTHGTAATAHGTTASTHGTAASARETAGGGTLLPHDEGDKLGERLHHAVAGFVDAPRESVEEADRVLEEVAARLADAVTHRRRSLRTSWQDAGADGAAASTDTEQLRLALRDYRELTDRLMRL
ncbi:hypothetical protein [Streptomyces parvulus]|uniref:hypothetical protein n=1 Tax=Streptomyces parvulus TaxID=146923 RepID=UPI0037D7B59B